MTGGDLPDEYKCVLPSRRHPLHLDEPGRISFEVTIRPPKVDLNQPVLVRFGITDAEGPREFVESEAKWYDLDLHSLENLGLMLTCANEIRGSFTEASIADITEIYKNVGPRRMYHRLVETVYGHEFGLWSRQWRGRSGTERVERELLLFGWTFWLGEAAAEHYSSDKWLVAGADLCSTGYMLVDPEECVVFGRELARTAADVGVILFNEANRRGFWDDPDADEGAQRE